MIKKLSLICILLFVSCLSCFAFIKDINDWEQEILKLPCVESVESERLDPDDDDFLYKVKIRMTENRYLQVSYFEPFAPRGYQDDFYLDRIGDLVPVMWGYGPSSKGYNLDYRSLRFKHISSYFDKKKNLIDVIKAYDEIYSFISKLPDYDINLPEETIEWNKENTQKPEFKSWDESNSPYVYSNFHNKTKYRKYWEEYKIYKMTVEDFNEYVLSRGWNFHVLDINP